MSTTPHATTIIVAAVTQFLLVLLFFVGHVLLGRSHTYRKNIGDAARVLTMIVFFAVLSGLLFFLSEDFQALLAPKVHLEVVPGLALTPVLSVMFILDAVTVTILVWLTGGSRISPFLPILFALPPLAIFLAVTPTVYTLIIVWVAACYTGALQARPDRLREFLNVDYNDFRRQKLGYWFLALASFALTSGVAYVLEYKPWTT